MKLSNEQIKELLKKPKNSQQIQEGRKYESNLRLFTESLFKVDLEKENSWHEYKKDLSKKLSKPKFDKIVNYINFPLPIIDISNSCCNELYKVFDARNTYFNEEYSTAQIKSAIDPIIKEMNINEWIIRKGKEVIKNKPNLICVIDKDELGKPYLLGVESERLYDYELESDDCSELEYIIFIHSVVMNGDRKETRYSVYDDEFYRVYLDNDGEYYLETEQSHTMGECPARMFLHEKLNSAGDFNRKIPFSNVISKMKEWQNFDTFRNYVDHYAPFPVLEAPEEKCSVDGCEGGYIPHEDEYYENEILKTRTILNKCPSCESRDLIGPGTVIRIPSKQDKDDPSESGVFKMISNDVQSLNYIKEKLADLENHIMFKTVGLNTIIQKEAINEEQVEGSYDSRQNVLLALKCNFDGLYKWIIESVAKLINPNAEVNVTADFGTEFYLLDEDDLQARFEYAKKIGLPESEIDSIFKQLIDTKYKGNANKINRTMLLKYIDPQPFKTLNEVQSLYEKNLLSNRDLILKVDLINFVDRFEMENGPINEFGITLKPYARIEKIMETFNKYIDERVSKQSAIQQV